MMARVGTVLSALAVFACGWLAMRTDDWRLIVAYSALALVAALLAQAFARRSR
jgi:NADH:ubiquinone oxidoreductase subunit 4 (subunit M)